MKRNLILMSTALLETRSTLLERLKYMTSTDLIFPQGSQNRILRSAALKRHTDLANRPIHTKYQISAVYEHFVVSNTCCN